MNYVIYWSSIGKGGYGMMEEGQYERIQRATIKLVEERRRRQQEEEKKVERSFEPSEPVTSFEAAGWDDAVEIFRSKYKERSTRMIVDAKAQRIIHHYIYADGHFYQRLMRGVYARIGTAKAAKAVLGIVVAIPGSTNFYKRTHRCVREVTCPYCNSPVGVLCRGAVDYISDTHYQRRQLARKQRKERETT